MQATPKLKAWSVSRLQTFESCPRKYFHLNIAKDVKEDFSGEHAEYGSAAHKACELFISQGMELPTRFEHFRPLLKKIQAAKGDVYTELQLTLNEELKPTGWFDADAYIRGIIDVMKVNKHVAWVGDYKTGKMKDDIDQLKLFALLVFKYFGDVDTVISSFIWLKEGTTTTVTFTRDEVDDIIADLIPRAKRIEFAIETEQWQPRTSGLCRFCPVKQQGKCNFG